MNKSILLVLIGIGSVFAQLSSADDTIIAGRAAEAFFKKLGGHALSCELANPTKKALSNYNKGYFPFTISMTPTKKKGEFKLEIACHKRDVRWGVGGDDVGFEMSSNWLIIESGDDGREHLLLSDWYEYDGTVNCSDKFWVTSPINGVLIAEWAGFRMVDQVMCCFK